MAVKNRLKQIRHELLIDSQIQMAKMLGIKQQQYNRYEHQQIQPTLETALKIARILKRPIEEIFYLDDSSSDK